MKRPSASILLNRGPETSEYPGQIQGKAGEFEALAPSGGLEFPIASVDARY
jgi:hypothetical protein